MHFTASHPNSTNEEIDDDYGYSEDIENISHSKWNDVLHECENYNLSDYSYGSSTIISESIGESSSDYCEIDDVNLNFKPTALEKENSVNISVEHSTDVLFGNKTFFTGPVVIKNFIAEGDTINGNQRDTCSDSPDTVEIIEKDGTAFEKSLDSLHAFVRSRPVTFLTAIVGVLIVVASALIGYYLISSQEEPAYFELISRNEYDALPRRGVLLPLNLPVKYVIIAHTEGANCTDLQQCKDVVRHVQWYHMNINGWDEVGLNFMVGGDGRVYEGSGYEEGAHTLGYNFDSVCISFVGNFTEYEPTKQQFVAAKRLIDHGVKENKIQSEYVLYAHRQLRGGDSPGKYVYDEIISWKQWSAIVIPK